MIEKIWRKNLILLFLIISISNSQENTDPYVVVLGIAQDGGYPQAGCTKDCCSTAWKEPDRRRHVTCLAIVDPESKQRWIIDATPDFKYQLHALNKIFAEKTSPGLDGIFITHGHIGHYAGLIHLGREVMGAQQIPLYVMPRMAEFIRQNGPWNLLVQLENIRIVELKNTHKVELTEYLSVLPLQVPHRGEFTETVAYKIEGPERKILYLPDIDKWSDWDEEVEDYIRASDIAYLDATFFSNGEIPGRNMADIPHPFITESMERFSELPVAEKAKIRFIHFNHTNPVLNPANDAREMILRNDFQIAEEGEIESL